MRELQIIPGVAKYYLLCLLLVAFIHSNYGQNADALNQNYTKESIATFDNRYEGVKGSPFLFDEWLPGILYLDFENGNKSEVREIKIKLDVFKQFVYANPNGSNQVLQLDKDIEKVKIFQEDDTLTYYMQNVNGKLKVTERLTMNEPLLIKAYHKVFREADYQGGYSADRKYDEYKSDDNLFILSQR